MIIAKPIVYLKLVECGRQPLFEVWNWFGVYWNWIDWEVRFFKGIGSSCWLGNSWFFWENQLVFWEDQLLNVGLICLSFGVLYKSFLTWISTWRKQLFSVEDQLLNRAWIATDCGPFVLLKIYFHRGSALSISWFLSLRWRSNIHWFGVYWNLIELREVQV